jgi:hypothetical protein
MLQHDLVDASPAPLLALAAAVEALVEHLGVDLAA